MCGLLFDELADMTTMSNMHKKLVAWTEQFMGTHFQEDYVVDLDDQGVVDGLTDSRVDLAIDEDASIALNLFPLALSSVEAGSDQKVSPFSCVAQCVRYKAACMW